MRATLSKWWHYLLGKRSEVAQMDYKDAYMAKVVLDIHRKRRDKRIVRVPLARLEPIHRIDRENALAATRARAEALRAHREALRAAGVLDGTSLQAIIPSVSAIKVVQDGERWLAFEGNGRLYAMRDVFAPEDGMQVEVEEYIFDDDRSIRRRLNRVRRLNRLDLSPVPLRLSAILLAASLVGCAPSPREQRFGCHWHDTDAFAVRATEVDAKTIDGRLVALRIESTTGGFTERPGGTCVYDLRERRFQHVVGAQGEPRLRIVNARGEGTGYVDYQTDDATLTIDGLDELTCAAGGIELPITMTRDPDACRIRGLAAR